MDLEISSLSFADDIILIANSHKTLQKLIDICGNWTRSNGMNFNVSKCKIMTLNVRKSPTSFYLLGEVIDFVNEYKYLGVTLLNKRQTSLFTHHISAILGKADRRLNCIRHFGYHSDVPRPSTGIVMFKTLARLILKPLKCRFIAIITFTQRKIFQHNMFL